MKTTSKPNGRPTKYTAATVDRLCEAISTGTTLAGACVAAGIGDTTLREWRDQHPEILARIDQAREEGRQKALSAIKAAGAGGDWRAWAEWLKLSFPLDYRAPAPRMELNLSGPTQIVIPASAAALLDRLMAMADTGEIQSPTTPVPAIEGA